MQIPDLPDYSSSRRTFLKQTFAGLFVPKQLLQLGEVGVNQLVLHVRKNIQKELLGWFMENECEFDSFSLILLRASGIDIKVPFRISDEKLARQARGFLDEYDSCWPLLDEGADLDENGKSARKMRRFLDYVIDYLEDKGDIEFTEVKKIVSQKRNKILQALKCLPPKLGKALQEHSFWIDSESTSHLKDFQRQFFTEILGEEPGDEVIAEEYYDAKLRELEPLLGDIVENEISIEHYHDREINNDRIMRGVQEYSSGKWSSSDFKHVPKFLQIISSLVFEKVS